MSRSVTIIRKIAPDHKYKSVNVSSLINRVMSDGKKSIAEKIVYSALIRLGDDPAEILNQALNNLSPDAEVRYKKVGGSTCAVPREPNQRRKQFYAMSWLLQASRSRSEHTMAEKLAAEIAAAQKNEGNAIAKKIELHKLAENNRAYAVLNW